MATSVYEALDQQKKGGQSVGMLQRMRLYKREVEKYVVFNKTTS